jgi:RNA polymerase sigma-70 factor (ECF subfamily)
MIQHFESSLTSTSLIVRAKKRDQAAWERLATLYTPVVYQWARQANLQENDAADLVQDVFQTVGKDLHRFERASHLPRFRAWLWGITRHKLLDFFRRRKLQPQRIFTSELGRHSGG